MLLQMKLQSLAQKSYVCGVFSECRQNTSVGMLWSCELSAIYGHLDGSDSSVKTTRAQMYSWVGGAVWATLWLQHNTEQC